MDRRVEFLRPYGKWMIIDCVSAAGIDVSAWSLSKAGKLVALPQSNGGYCYGWSFKSADRKTLVVCIWFEEIQRDERGRVVFRGNLKKYAEDLSLKLERLPENHKKTVKAPRIRRARAFDEAIHLAYLNSTPLRVVIVSRSLRNDNDPDSEIDHAVGRDLDKSSWFVEKYDSDTGEMMLVRTDDDIVADEVVVADQFTTEGRPDTYTYNGIQRYRDPSVRRLVLNRSEGSCELTGGLGFLMANGRRYLETHHIIPLSEGGADTVENVIALSADAHRQAHFGVNRDELRERCLEIVAWRMAR